MNGYMFEKNVFGLIIKLRKLLIAIGKRTYVF